MVLILSLGVQQSAWLPPTVPQLNHRHQGRLHMYCREPSLPHPAALPAHGLDSGELLLQANWSDAVSAAAATVSQAGKARAPSPLAAQMWVALGCLTPHNKYM